MCSTPANFFKLWIANQCPKKSTEGARKSSKCRFLEKKTIQHAG